MKHFTPRLIMFLTVAALLCGEAGLFAATPIKREFRAVWVSTVYCLDWPEIHGRGPARHVDTYCEHAETAPAPDTRLYETTPFQCDIFPGTPHERRPLQVVRRAHVVIPYRLAGRKGKLGPARICRRGSPQARAGAARLGEPVPLGGLGYGRLEHAVGPGSKGKRLDTLNFERKNPKSWHSRSGRAHSKRMQGNYN